jgi:hypothetical protein
MSDAPVKKSRKPREPEGPREGSLGAKLFHMRVGEMIGIPDDWHEKGKATTMERQVGSLMYRMPYLVGRQYLTKRIPVVIDREAVPLLMIQRVQ